MIVQPRHKDSLIGKMENSEFVFYLTGSRFFGGFNPASDWDYFAEDSPEIRKFLYSLGFQEDDNIMNQYDDSTIVTVLFRNDVQVQLVQNVLLKEAAQTFLSTYALMKSTPKEARKYLWNMAISWVLLHELVERHGVSK